MCLSQHRDLSRPNAVYLTVILLSTQGDIAISLSKQHCGATLLLGIYDSATKLVSLRIAPLQPILPFTNE